MDLIEERGHEYVEGHYKNRSSVLIIWCPEHGNEYVTTFYNYKRSRTGCLCCGRKQVSDKLKNREFSPETIEKMIVAAQGRPNRGGRPRRWRETHNYRKWREAVLKAYDNKCAITGYEKRNPGDLEIHHLYGTKTYPHLAYSVENGIVLHCEIHKSFHLTYGYNSNTLEDFIAFISSNNLAKNLQKAMLISNQANSEGLEGSETRAYNPERVKKLLERLEGIRLLFNVGFANIKFVGKANKLNQELQE